MRKPKTEPTRDEDPQTHVAGDGGSDALEDAAPEMTIETEGAAGPDAGAVGNSGERIRELEERLLRLAAEFDNYRKRRQREQEDLVRFCTEGLVGGLVPVLDALDRAISAGEGTRDYQAFHDGVVLIRQQLAEVLQRHGVEREVPKGETFDPNRHEAVAAIPHEEVEEDHIVTVVEPGYVLNGRVVRPAKVVVSRGGTAAQAEDL